jgi:hypothetical protein
MFWGLATAVRYFEEPTPRRGVLLSVLTLATFFSHIFPFGIFGLGYAAMFPWTRPREWLRAAAPVVPAAIVLALWVLFTDAGRLTFGALADNSQDPHLGFHESLMDAPKQLLTVFADESNVEMVVAVAVVAVVGFGLAHGDPPEKKSPRARWYVLLPIACVFLFFKLPQGHGYIWLIAQRFPLLFAMTIIPLLRMPQGFRGLLVTAAVFGVGAWSTYNTCAHFMAFEKNDVGQFDKAVEAMEPGKKACALIYDMDSSQMERGHFHPFMHFGSYYQVEKGGLAMFTYTGYAHWPVEFQPGHLPPQADRCSRETGTNCEHAPLRWEWMPHSVSMNEIYPYYDYVLTRGNGPFNGGGHYHVKWEGIASRGARADQDILWRVWERE